MTCVTGWSSSSATPDAVLVTDETVIVTSTGATESGVSLILMPAEQAAQVRSMTDGDPATWMVTGPPSYRTRATGRALRRAPCTRYWSGSSEKSVVTVLPALSLTFAVSGT